MVKISNPFDDNNKQNKATAKAMEGQSSTEMSLNSITIQEMLKPVSKHETTPINLRLESSIAEQIKIYATEHNTTMTEVIKDIITEYYFNKKITRGTFNLKEPVNLIIPTSNELLLEYIENEVNVVSSIKQYGTHTSINPLDPQNNLYNISSSGYDVITVTQGNNLLDVYNSTDKCYSFMSEYEIYEDTPKLMEDVDHEIYKNTSHRGLIVADIKNSDNGSINSILLDVLIFSNQLIQAIIITPERAKELAVATGNMDLIRFMDQLDDYVNVCELVRYDNTNKELTKENYEIKKIIKDLIEENEALKLENEDLNKEIKDTFHNVEDNDYYKYVENIEQENKKLKEKIRTLEHKESERDSKIESLLNLLNEYMDYSKQ